MKNMPRWTIIFKALSNINRLKILNLLKSRGKMHVSDIAESLKISITATSNNLVMLQKLDVLETEGKDGQVFYELNARMPQDFAKNIKLFT